MVEFPCSALQNAKATYNKCMCTTKIFGCGRLPSPKQATYSFSLCNIQQTQPPTRPKTVGNSLAFTGL